MEGPQGGGGTSLAVVLTWGSRSHTQGRGLPGLVTLHTHTHTSYIHTHTRPTSTHTHVHTQRMLRLHSGAKLDSHAAFLC